METYNLLLNKLFGWIKIENKWHYIAITYDSKIPNGVNLYIDGRREEVTNWLK